MELTKRELIFLECVSGKRDFQELYTKATRHNDLWPVDYKWREPVRKKMVHLGLVKKEGDVLRITPKGKNFINLTNQKGPIQ